MDIFLYKFGVHVEWNYNIRETHKLRGNLARY